MGDDRDYSVCVRVSERVMSWWECGNAPCVAGGHRNADVDGCNGGVCMRRWAIGVELMWSMEGRVRFEMGHDSSAGWNVAMHRVLCGTQTTGITLDPMAKHEQVGPQGRGSHLCCNKAWGRVWLWPSGAQWQQHLWQQQARRGRRLGIWVKCWQHMIGVVHAGLPPQGAVWSMAVML